MANIINKHFNVASKKILSVDEIANRIHGANPDDVMFTKDLLWDFAEWKDAGGNAYLGEMTIKRLFSKLAGGGKKSAALFEKLFPKWQEAIDASEDHSDRLNAGRLQRKSSSPVS